MTRPSGPLAQNKTLPAELNRRYEARVARQTVLTELAHVATRTYGKEIAGLMALQVIRHLDHEDAWWAERERWQMPRWLDWAADLLVHEDRTGPLRQHTEPTNGFALHYTMGSR